MTAPSLDTLVARARAVGVRPGPAEQCVADVLRLARVSAPAPRFRWLVPVLAGCALAATGAAVVALMTRTDAPVVAASPVWVGDRVAVMPEGAASYRVVEAGGEGTTIEVTRGAVTARLLPDPAPHRLVLRGGGVEAVATGTVYTLSVDERADHVAEVRVHEGKVEVWGEQIGTVYAGATWFRRADGTESAMPSSRKSPLGVRAAEQLLALQPIVASKHAPPPTPPVVVTPVDAGELPDADPATDTSDARPAPSRRDPPTADPVDTSPEARWRRARLLRGQGKPDEARTLLLAISTDGDATWAPLAHIEAIRIDLEDLSAPENALALSDRMLTRWPHHALITEVRALRCRALGQLGRGAECERADAGVDAP